MLNVYLRFSCMFVPMVPSHTGQHTHAFQKMELQIRILRLQPGNHRENHRIHQEFQVPQMEGFLNLIAGYFLGVGKLPLHKPYIHTAYITVRIPPFGWYQRNAVWWDLTARKTNMMTSSHFSNLWRVDRIALKLHGSYLTFW